MKKALIILALTFGFVGFVLAAESTSEQYGVTVKTSERWKHTAAKSDGTISLFVFDDNENQANCKLWSVFAEQAKPALGIGSIREWVENKQRPAFEKWYAGNKLTYFAEESIDGTVKLSNGTEANFTKQSVYLKGGMLENKRSVLFVYWEKELAGKTVWHYLSCSNKFKDKILTPDAEPMSEFLKGITYH